MKQQLNILLADDHDYFLDGLQHDIEKLANFRSIFRSNNGYEILEIVEKNNIDILITDIEMPELDGIKAATKLRETNESLRIIFLTSFYDIQHIKPLLKLGIKVILDKENIKNEINAAINAILNNESYYTALIKETVTDILKGKRKTNRNTSIPVLTRREKELLQDFVRGLSNKEIADKIHLAPSTIDTHRSNIYLKFNVHNAAQLAAKVFQLGMSE